MDSYFEKQDKPTVFLVLGKEVVVDNERLATALSRLPQLRGKSCCFIISLAIVTGQSAGCIGVAGVR